jgi:glycosyltransferase involved in cell wall biosynthesis
VKIAHLGSHIGQQGGPPGYLLQLRRAFDAFGTGGCEVTLPPPKARASSRPAPTAMARLLQSLRRIRRHVVGAPAVYRPAAEAVIRRGGPIDAFMATAWRDIQSGGRESVDQGVSANADILFAHDAPTAELALEHRQRGQRVWLFMHTPMPLALYLSWCWGVPEAAWQEVARWPDVEEWCRRERDVIQQVDEVLLPCPEAHEEFARVDARFAEALRRATFLMTGAIGPARSWPDASRADVRHRFGLPVDVPIALYVGNAQPYRGLDALLESIRLMPGVSEVPGVVAIAGPSIETIALSRRLHALGPVSEVADLLFAVDGVINVNRFSLFDLSTIEALEAGCPLLMHRTGGNKTFARLGAGALIIDDIAPATIARALTRFFTTDAEARRLMGRASRAAYDNHTTLRQLRDRHISLYTRPLAMVREA